MGAFGIALLRARPTGIISLRPSRLTSGGRTGASETHFRHQDRLTHRPDRRKRERPAGRVSSSLPAVALVVLTAAFLLGNMS
jgi:hypothetical protein